MEAAKLAHQLRDRYLNDPDFNPVPTDKLLDSDQPGLAQLLQMGAGQLDADFSLGGQRLHGLVALAKQLNQLQPFRAGDDLAYARNLFVELPLKFSHAFILMIIGMSAKVLWQSTATLASTCQSQS